MQEIKVEYVSIDKIKPYQRNARKHDSKSIEVIANSISEFGMADPIAVWGKENIVIEGHGRLLALKQLGYDKAPIIHLDYLTDEQRRAYTLAHNKTAEFSEWDMELLTDEAESIFNIDLSDFGFDLSEEEEEETEIIEDEVPQEVEPVAKQGDIWQLGRHRLMCGSSTDASNIDDLLNGNTPDLIYTDPPYGMNAVSKSGVLSENYKTDILGDDDNTVAIDAFNLSMQMFKDVKAVWWGANYYTECLPSSECWIVWDKNNGASDQTDCELAWSNFRSVVRQFTMGSEKKNRVHPTQKPCDLFAQVVKKFDKNKEFNKVLDLFGGSGSTLIACEQLGKSCYMMELDPHYVDVIIARWEQFTGQKAVLLNGND